MASDGTALFSTGADGTRHAAAQIVVDGADVRALLGLLPKGAGPVGVEEIRALALSRLTFEDVTATVAALPSQPAGRYSPPGGADDVETLMAWLRSESDSKLHRVPEMGKDRVVLGGEGFPYSSPKIIPSGAYGPFAESCDRPPSRPARGRDGKGAVVGVLDTPVIQDPAFADTVSFLPGSRVAWGDVKQAWQGHGTFNVGLIHAQAPKAKVIVRAILQGEGFATAWETAKGMAELHAAGAQLINMSVGCVTGDRQPPFTLRAAVERLRGKALLVAAAGNYDPDADGLRPPTWPAALDGVFAVGSITEQSSSSSAFSPDEPWVDLSAVGENVTSTFKDGEVLCLLRGGAKRPRRFWGTAIWSGTSFAAATVTGRLAALAGASAPGPIADELRVGSRRDPVVRQP